MSHTSCDVVKLTCLWLLLFLQGSSEGWSCLTLDESTWHDMCLGQAHIWRVPHCLDDPRGCPGGGPGSHCWIQKWIHSLDSSHHRAWWHPGRVGCWDQRVGCPHRSQVPLDHSTVSWACVERRGPIPPSEGCTSHADALYVWENNKKVLICIWKLLGFQRDEYHQWNQTPFRQRENSLGTRRNILFSYISAGRWIKENFVKRPLLADGMTSECQTGFQLDFLHYLHITRALGQCRRHGSLIWQVLTAGNFIFSFPGIYIPINSTCANKEEGTLFFFDSSWKVSIIHIFLKYRYFPSRRKRRALVCPGTSGEKMTSILQNAFKFASNLINCTRITGNSLWY